MKIEIAHTAKGPVEYATIGTGKPVLFLHGGHSNCRETLFHKGFDTSKYQLITPSRPGYGNTPLNMNVTPKLAAELVVSLLHYLAVDNVIVYGISAGGLTAIEMAANYPDKVEKLILASAVSKEWLDKNGKIYKTAKKLFDPITEKFVWGMTRLFSGIFPGMIATNFYPQFSKNKSHPLDKNDIKELLTAFNYYNSKQGFITDIEHTIAPGLISKVTCPTLIIHSKNDNSVPFEHAAYAHKMISNSKLVVLDNEWGHLFWIGKDSHESIKKTLTFIEQ
ncbi:alpha/beta fold hydrolase [Pontibacter sp. MBLB2868]|uniref:alpha/beta fold hydrolase n=1 Tax=Pontibacter sp. MBLB2868 TaxID=3451555 RepID=UPI003F74C492